MSWAARYAVANGISGMYASTKNVFATMMRSISSEKFSLDLGYQFLSGRWGFGVFYVRWVLWWSRYRPRIGVNVSFVSCVAGISCEDMALSVLALLRDLLLVLVFMHFVHFVHFAMLYAPAAEGMKAWRSSWSTGGREW